MTSGSRVRNDPSISLTVNIDIMLRVNIPNLAGESCLDESWEYGDIYHNCVDNTGGEYSGTSAVN